MLVAMMRIGSMIRGLSSLLHRRIYVLDAPLGDGPIVGVDADVMNVWQARYDDYLIV